MESTDELALGDREYVSRAEPLRTVEEAMSRELFAVGPAEPAEQVIRYLLLLGLTGAPVIDDDGKPVGMLSIRDYLSRSGETAGERMATPVVMIWAHASLKDAAELLSDTGHHRAVVVDEAGQAVGMLSALDLVRALTGQAVSHPHARAEYDSSTNLVWTSDSPLDFEHAHEAPEGPGLFVLTGSDGALDRVVWVETADDLRARLLDLVMRKSVQPSPLARALERDDIRFRAALEPDASARERALQTLLGGSE